MRAIYTKSETYADAPWYCLSPLFDYSIDDITRDDPVKQPALLNIKAYKVPPRCNLFEAWNEICVSQRFVDFCRDEKVSGADFLWIRDTGRYAAPPYYVLVPQNAVTSATTLGSDLNRSDVRPYRQADSDGGHLAALSENIDELQHIKLSVMISEHTPDKDIAYIAYQHRVFILISKSFADKLMNAGLIQKSELSPVRYYDKDAHSLLIRKYLPAVFADADSFALRDAERMELERKVRPVYAPTDKSALSLLRKAKRARYDDFHKPAKLPVPQELRAYYAITDGGYLSEETELYHAEDIPDSTAEFRSMLKAEEDITDRMPELLSAAAFGRTANGDIMLILPSGEVLRYNHEDPTQSIRWNTAASFFTDSTDVG